MKPIRIDNGVVVYYGNRVGRITNGQAVVDPMFNGQELIDFLEKQRGIREVKWTDGIFDCLIEGAEKSSETWAQKDCRVWQLKSDVDIRMKFISYDDLCREFGQPRLEDYQKVYDGAVDTNDLETLYTQFSTAPPVGYGGHPLSISDVLELYDESGSEFHYVDRIGFQPVSFERPEPKLMEDDPVLEFYHRIDKEYAAYIKQMESRPQKELIQKAVEITAMKVIYQSLRDKPYLFLNPSENPDQQEYPLEAIRSCLLKEPIVLEQAILDAYKETAWPKASMQTMQL